MTLVKKTKNQKLNVFLLRQYKNLAKSLSEKKSTDSIGKIIADNVHALGKKFDLEQLVYALASSNDEYKVEFKNYINLNVKEIKSLAINLDCIQLGYYVTLISNIAFRGNLIENRESKKPMQRKELTILLQISNESCRELIITLVKKKLILEGSMSNKLALYCPENIAFKKKIELESDLISTIKKKNSRTLIFSGYVVENPIFQKQDRKMRKNFGKETLGVFVKMTLLMNDEQEIKSRSTKDVLMYLNSKINVVNFIYHYNLLVQSNFVQCVNNIVYVNPTAIKRYRKNVSENIIRIFDLKGKGDKMNLPLN